MHFHHPSVPNFTPAPPDASCRVQPTVPVDASHIQKHLQFGGQNIPSCLDGARRFGCDRSFLDTCVDTREDMYIHPSHFLHVVGVNDLLGDVEWRAGVQGTTVTLNL